MKKVFLSLATVVLGVTGVMNVALADNPPDRMTVCVVSAGQGTPDHEVTIAEPATDAPAFAPVPCPPSLTSVIFGGFGGGGGGGGGRVDAADTNDELADTE